MRTHEGLVFTDAERIDWMERHLQHPAEVTLEDTGEKKQCNAWALAGRPGYTLRETVDFMMTQTESGKLGPSLPV